MRLQPRVLLPLLALAVSACGDGLIDGGSSPGVTVTRTDADGSCPAGGQRIEVTVPGSAQVTVAHVCDGAAGAPAHVDVADEPAGAHCAGGGKAIATSVGSGPAVVSYVCNGVAATVVASAEPPGASCPNGGTRLQVGSAEPSYVCHGAAGVAGDGVTTTAEPAGAHCASGGVRLQAGAAAATYVCTGAPGSSVTTAALPPGDAHCANGGSSFTVDGSTTYACSGAEGGSGASVTMTAVDAGEDCAQGGVMFTVSGATTFACNGQDAQSVVVTEEAAGAHCANGGVRLQVGADAPTYVCSGEDGRDALSRIDYVSAEETGFFCGAGGLRIQSGLDLDGDGWLDDGEISTSGLVCNGDPGHDGTPGQDGEDGVCAGNHAPIVDHVDYPLGAIAAGEPAQVTVTALDQDHDALSYSIVGGGGLFQDDGHGAFTFLPVEPGGPRTYSAIVSDGCQIAVQAFTIDAVAQRWTRLGGDLASNPRAHEIAILGGIPYVSSTDWTDLHHEVARLGGGSWIDASVAGAPAGFQTALAAHQGKLYWAGPSGAFRVRSAGGWTALAAYAGMDVIAGVKLFSDGADLYLAYLHNEDDPGLYNKRIGVKKYDPVGDAWSKVGYAGADGLGVWAYGGYFDLDLYVEAGQPYVLYTRATGSDWSENTNEFVVLTHGGGAWSAVGAPVADGGVHYSDHLAVLDGQVFVSRGGNGRLWRYAGGSWSDTGFRAASESPMAVVRGTLYVVGPWLTLYRHVGDGWLPIAVHAADTSSPIVGLMTDGTSLYAAYSDRWLDVPLRVVKFSP